MGTWEWLLDITCWWVLPIIYDRFKDNARYYRDLSANLMASI